MSKWNEKFTKKVQIESRVLADLANHIVPTGIKYMSMLLENHQRP